MIPFDTAAAAVRFIQEYENRRLNKSQEAINKSIEEWIDEIEFIPGDMEEDDF
jgi:hypothetical protein